MNEYLSMDQVFIRKITQIVLDNMEDENFGVNELVKKAGISRSSIHRKLKIINNQSISQFIREARLNKAMEMLRQNVSTVAEIAFRVGFSSPTYFNKCFHDFYGITPNEVRKKGSETHSKHDKEDVTKSIRAFGQKISKTVIRRFLFPFLVILILPGSLLILHKISLSRRLTGDKFHMSKEYEKSIAVLPLKNISDNPDNQYFADGFMEDILNNLFRINGLRVISRTTTEQFKGSRLSVPQIADKIHANYVLEGSVQRHDNRVRVAVQLIDAGRDQHIWSNEYDRELTDIFTIQSQIAIQIANELRILLSAKEIENIERNPTTNIQAYNYYLQGRYFMNRRTQDGVLKSLDWFKKAIDEDPDYDLAIAGLADVYRSLSNWGLLPMSEGYGKSKELALKALAINKELAQAHALLGYILGYGEFRWEAARKEFVLATELAPYNSTAHQYYSQFLYTTGQIYEARKEINMALKLDPFSLTKLRISAGYYIDEGKFEEAISELRKMEEIDPVSLERNYLYLEIYIRKGEGLKAVEALELILLSNPKTAEYAEKLKTNFNTSGLQGIFSSMIDLYLKDPNPFILSTYYALNGQKNKALDWLEKSFKSRSANSVNNFPEYICDIYLQWQFEDLRSEPRFLELLDKMRLSKYYRHIPISKITPE